MGKWGTCTENGRPWSWQWQEQRLKEEKKQIWQKQNQITRRVADAEILLNTWHQKSFFVVARELVSCTLEELGWRECQMKTDTRTMVADIHDDNVVLDPNCFCLCTQCFFLGNSFLSRFLILIFSSYFVVSDLFFDPHIVRQHNWEKTTIHRQLPKGTSTQWWQHQMLSFQKF